MSRYVVPTGDELQFVVFRLGDRELAFSITQVERILRYEQPEPWPKGPRFIEGLLPFGNSTVPLLDLRRRTGLDSASREEARTMVLVNEALPLAVVVDQVREVLRVDTRTIRRATGEVAGLPDDVAGGLIERAGRTIMILNAARLLPSAERQALSEALRE
jgi:purine-binding chemotaxis protein CheW